MANIFEVLQGMGYATRDTVFFADNDNRLFSIKGGNNIVIMEVTDSLVKKIPTLNGIFEFNMLTLTTNATDEQVAEIQKIIEIRPFAEVA